MSYLLQQDKQSWSIDDLSSTMTIKTKNSQVNENLMEQIIKLEKQIQTARLEISSLFEANQRDVGFYKMQVELLYTLILKTLWKFINGFIYQLTSLLHCK